MSKMDLSEVTFNDIEVKLMSVLCANVDTKYTHASLFNKLIQDKYDDIIHIPQIFKTKFLLVLSNLPSMYDDLTIEKDNNIVTIIYNSNEKKEKSEESEKLEEKDNSVIEGGKHGLGRSDTLKMYEYIFENDMKEYINKVDKFTGNTIYHELVKEHNITLIKTLVKQNKFNYYVENHDNKKPCELSESQEITNILMNGLFEEIKLLRKEINIKNNAYDNKILQLDNKIIDMRKADFKHHLMLVLVIIIAIALDVFTKANKH